MKKIVLWALTCLVLTSYSSFALIPFPASQKNKNFISGHDDQDKPSDARTYKTDLGNSKDKIVVIMLTNSDVQVIGHNSDEVIIEARASTSLSKRAIATRPNYDPVKDNTGLGLEVEKKDENVLAIIQAPDESGKYAYNKYTIKVPKKASVAYRETNQTNNDFALRDVEGELEIGQKNGNVTLTNVNGPIVADIINGDLNIKFTRLDQSKPSSVIAVKSNVDISLPADTKADFEIQAVPGKIYSDFDMDPYKGTKSDLPLISGGQNMKGKTNGGGVEMRITAMKSDVFIRKIK